MMGWVVGAASWVLGRVADLLLGPAAEPVEYVPTSVAAARRESMSLEELQDEINELREKRRQAVQAVSRRPGGGWIF